MSDEPVEVVVRVKFTDGHSLQSFQPGQKLMLPRANAAAWMLQELVETRAKFTKGDLKAAARTLLAQIDDTRRGRGQTDDEWLRAAPRNKRMAEAIAAALEVEAR